MFRSQECGKSEILLNYERRVQELRELAKEWNFSNEEFDEILKDAFNLVEEQKLQENEEQKLCENNRRNGHYPNRTISTMFITIVGSFLKCVLCLVLVLSLIYCVIACHNPTQKFLTRYIQGFIYPFMKHLRIVTIPLINKYPSLTGKFI